MTRLGASVVIVEGGHVLLKRSERYGTWGLPGGLVEDDESVAQAAVREVQEETGLEVHLERLIGVYSRPHWRGGGLHIVVFAAQPVGGRLQPDPGEVLEARYFDPAALPDSLPTGMRLQIRATLAGVGGGIAWSDDAIWPFATDLSQEVLDDLRDGSGLPGPEFVRQYFPETGDITVEVAPK